MKSILSKEDIDQIRLETLACNTLNHFNNAGSSLPPDCVVESVVNYLKEEALIGGYEAEAKYAGELQAVYKSIATFINSDPDEIAIFENASGAWITAFKGLDLKSGDEIITSEMEYVTGIIGFAQMKRDLGISIKVIPNDAKGNFSLLELEQAITPNTKLIAVTHVSSSGGSILPVEEIGKIAEKHGLIYLLDACQSAGQIPLDVQKIKCHMLSATGRKYLRAPRGTGFLFVKKDVQDKLKPVLLDFLAVDNVSLEGYTLRQDARRFELFEKSRALTLGLGTAVDYALNIGMEAIWINIQKLSSYMRKSLSAIPEVTICDKGDNLSGIVTFIVHGIDSVDVKTKLSVFRINVSVGGAQATPIYMEKNQFTAVVRASVHYYNTEDEINELCNRVQV
ncbi:MAG: aminotransferase class V-fold PLP-dependent enzyme [Pedobacter sp.]|nr:MAG: aminotransferase class V-fold PLP-dependent enzyme [Pedobacter sp.]